MGKPTRRDRDRAGGQGNVFPGPWPEREEPGPTIGAPSPERAASNNCWRNANAIESGVFETDASAARPRDEFFDALYDSNPAGEDVDAFIARAATPAAETAAQGKVAGGSAGLPADLALAPRQRRIRLASFRDRARRRSAAKRRARDDRERKGSAMLVPRRVAAAAACAAVLAVITAVVSSSLSETPAPRRDIVASAQRARGPRPEHSSSGLRAHRRAANRRTRAHRAARPPRRGAGHPPHHGVSPPTRSRVSRYSAQPVAYVEPTARLSASSARASASATTTSDTPARGASKRPPPAASGPTGAGAPFQPGQQVK